MFCLTLYTCASRKILVHNTRLDASSAPTNSASVLIFVLSFFFRDTYMIDPFTIANVDLVCYLKSECTINDTSTYHLRQLALSDFNLRRNYWVPTIYFISLSILFQYP